MDAGRVLFAGGHAPPALQSWAAASGRIIDVTSAGTAGLEHFLAHPAGLVIAVIHMETMGDLAALARLRELPSGRDVPLIVLCRPAEVERIARFTEQLSPLAVLPEPIDIARLSELHPAAARADSVDQAAPPAAEVLVRPRAQRGAAAPPPEDTRAHRSAAPTPERELDAPLGRRSRVPVADDVVVRRRPASQPDLPAVEPRSARNSAPPAPTGLPSDDLRSHMRELGKQNNFERLGLTASATQSDIDGAFEALVARLQPECYRDPSDLAMAESLLKAIRLAYDTLHTPHKRAEYASRLQATRQKPTEPTRPALNSAFSDLLAEAERASEAVLVQAPAHRMEAPVVPPEPSVASDAPLMAAVVTPPPISEPEPPMIPPDPAGSSILTFLRSPKTTTPEAAAPAPSATEPALIAEPADLGPISMAAPVGAEASQEPVELPSFDDVDAIFGGDLDWSAALPDPTPDTAPAATAKPDSPKAPSDDRRVATPPADSEVGPASPPAPNRMDRLAPKSLDRPRKTPMEALEAGPRDWIVEARYLLFIGDYVRAVTLLDACLAAEPNIRRYHYYRGLALGRAHAESGRFVEARRALDDAVRHAGSGQTEASQALQELAHLERRRA